jgi:hypothetical protein
MIVRHFVNTFDGASVTCNYYHHIPFNNRKLKVVVLYSNGKVLHYTGSMICDLLVLTC